MANLDLSPYATGGAAARGEISFSGMDNRFLEALARMISEAPANIRSNLQIHSGFRPKADQDRLFANAVKKYGSESAARKWVGVPLFLYPASWHAQHLRQRVERLADERILRLL